MNDLHRQLRGYGAQLVDEQQPITATDALATLEPVRTLEPLGTPEPIRELPVRPPGDRRRRPVWIAAVSAAAVLIVIGLGPVLGGGTSTTAPATVPTVLETIPQTATTTLATTTTSTSTPLAPPTVSWEAVSFEPGEGPQHGSVSAGDDELLVLQRGYEVSSDGTTLVPVGEDPRTILWTSPDGRRWEEHILQLGEVAYPGIFREVGGTYVITVTGEDFAYISNDLDTWTPWVQMALHQIVATDDVVVGHDGWSIVRADLDFTNTEILDAPFGGEPGDRMLAGIAATSDRFYAVVYSDTGRSSVWSSADGIDWTLEIDPPDDGLGAYDASIAANADRVLVYLDRAREAGTRRRVFWTAASGEPLQQVLGPSDGGAVSIDAVDDGFLVGTTLGQGFDISDIGPTQWHLTADGSSWESADAPPGDVPGVAGFGDTVIGQTGHWVREAGEDWSRIYFEPDPGWIIGTIRPG